MKHIGVASAITPTSTSRYPDTTSKVLARTIVIAAMLTAVGLGVFPAQVNAQEPKQENKQETKQEQLAEAPKVLAVEFYADWCTACKVLMPKIAEAKNDLKGKSLLFVRFDMTDEFTKSQASYMAGFSGLQDVLRKGGGKTGMVALVDADSKAVLGVIGQKKSVEEIKAMFNDAISKASVN